MPKKILKFHPPEGGTFTAMIDMKLSKRYSNQMRQVREEKGEEFGPGYWTEDEIISAMEPAVSDTIKSGMFRRSSTNKKELTLADPRILRSADDNFRRDLHHLGWMRFDFTKDTGLNVPGSRILWKTRPEDALVIVRMNYFRLVKILDLEDEDFRRF
ncbi:predicted protein [Histoplasma capsulatum G186AR]|uniref:Uncharacterized protein n=1 Tax=Ajellomyces capsulatus (strain G186AR / H82 / ATCC MYA-2454 / RMSCC 2432) TaxID=447093 RepID=C0NTT4_AJECG|nr:uncharacterized protein HCBG_06564 [Histoplasma capsulatum G186AR]EEH05445.1 predicted protein [Histoplasma capsulatum G186AR]